MGPSARASGFPGKALGWIGLVQRAEGVRIILIREATCAA